MLAMGTVPPGVERWVRNGSQHHIHLLCLHISYINIIYIMRHCLYCVVSKEEFDKMGKVTLLRDSPVSFIFLPELVYCEILADGIIATLTVSTLHSA